MSVSANATALGIALWSAAVLAACSGSDEASGPTGVRPVEQSTPLTPASPPAPPSTAPPSTSPPGSLAASPASPCDRTGTEAMGRIATTDLAEVSGLAASRAHPGVLWSHNDGGGRAGIFAIGPDGSDLGFHDLAVDAVDVEDMAIASDPAGDLLYLADIGDNDEERPSVSVFRFAEPDPASPGTIDPVERFDFTYPDRPHNAETLLVDERNDRVVIVTKEQAANDDGTPDQLGATELAFVFEGALDPSSSAGAPTMLTEVGVVDTLRLEELAGRNGIHPSTIFGFGGVVTGGDVAADGSFVALRTYETVWVWELAAAASVAEALVSGGQACEVTTISELQGEAIAFDGDELVTVGEGVQQPINRLGR